MPARVALLDDALDDRACLLVRQGRQVALSQHFADGAGGDGLSLVEHHDLVGQPAQFIHRMRDVEHRYRELVT